MCLLLRIDLTCFCGLQSISDMFQPGDLICSVQSTHNNIRIVGEQEELPAFVPKSLKEEVASLSNSNGDSTSKRPLLRSYE
jgi:hypothetical protein